MKLLRAEFHNFRLLRDLEMSFSIDSERPLTVIRAANESGKTTILTALQWALYGDSSLPGKGEGFRLHPIDWPQTNNDRVPITVTVEFEITTLLGIPGNRRESRKKYRIIRSAYEDVDSSQRRGQSTVQLYRLDDSGAFPIDAPEAIINDELPPELREVFFTDGDRALSFIEADVAVSTKRERVQRAIRSLLGLGIIEDALRHVRISAAEANRKAKNIGAGREIEAATTRLESIQKEETRLEKDLADAKEQFISLDLRYGETERKISTALQKGDKQKLQADLERARRQIKNLEDQIGSAKKEHTALFRSRFLATDLLASVFEKAFTELETLHDQGKIPNTTIPVLEERLNAMICICGESLDVSDDDGARRRNYIQTIIDDSEKSDEIQEIITDLFYGGKQLLPLSGKTQWLDEYKKVFERWSSLEDLREDAGRELRALEIQLAAVPDTDIQGLRQVQNTLKDQLLRYQASQSSIETQLLALARERAICEQDRDRLLREEVKGSLVIAELDVIHDVKSVLENSYRRITDDELTKVSELMNTIFLEMIGSDPEQEAIIRRAEISPEFDILVIGPNQRKLNPDRDLNGASRRALTFAFILALTKVSEVEAPNVIDTPLGMTSGFVKRSILRTAIRESGQLVLFLTPDEISGCEDILDASAGAIVTLTNPTHYPLMLVNDPGLKESAVMLCKCNHRSSCNICERRLDAVPLS